MDNHAVDLKDQPIGLALQGKANPIVITNSSVITVNVRLFLSSSVTFRF